MTNPQPLRSTANPVPVRRAGSIRRTTSIDVTWPDGPEGNRLLTGRSRDILTMPSGQPDKVRAEAAMTAMIDFHRTILSISADPAPARLQALVGERGGGHLRGVLREVLPELIEQGSPLYLLLDDISGTSLVSHWGMSQWLPGWQERMRKFAEDSSPEFSLLADRVGVCWGFREGSAVNTNPELHITTAEAADGKDLRNPADPDGWHAFPQHDGMAFRRARRIDVWREDGAIRIEASFQDSAPRPDGGRAALHEYVLHVSVDAASQTITGLEPEPRVLPFWDCPGAIANALKLVGTPLGHIRDTVLSDLRGPKGCTHLNDALRALGEVPGLIGFMDRELA